MHDHVILIGYGRIGRKTAAQVSRAGVDVLVVATDPTCCDAAEAAGLPVFRADPRCDATPQQAVFRATVPLWQPCRAPSTTSMWPSVPGR